MWHPTCSAQVVDKLTVKSPMNPAGAVLQLVHNTPSAVSAGFNGFEGSGMDTDTLSKLELYKTAYCPLHRFYVGIVSVRYDDTGRPIIYARPQDTNKVWAFRMEELTGWVL